jgi:nitroreductase
MEQLWATAYKDRIAAAEANPDAPESVAMNRLGSSAQHLADHWDEVPLFLFAFALSDPSGGSIFPAVWSAMLAARAEGIGTCLTTILAFRKDEVYDLLGIPADGGWNMACCVSMGYPTGKWGVAERRPVHEVSFRNRWNEPVGFEANEPLWTGEAE